MRIGIQIITIIIFAAFASSSLSARELVINVVGDIMLAGSGVATFEKLGYDYPFVSTREELKKGDITVGNLEAPIAVSGKVHTVKRYLYMSTPQTAQALKNAGFSVVTIANNHIMDFGPAALAETLQNLGKYGIACTGGGANLAAARKPAIITVGKLKVAFLAYSFTYPDIFYATAKRPGAAPGFSRYITEDIIMAKKTADYVVVSFHWGEENAVALKPYQIAAAHDAIDAGADLIFGHHPHVLQGIERYKKGLILYSLGNFAFGTKSNAAKRSVIARVFLENGIKRVEVIPLNVMNSEVHYQTQILTGEKGRKVIEHLDRLSAKRGTALTNVDGRYLVKMDKETRLARD